MPKAALIWCIKGCAGVLTGNSSRSKALLANLWTTGSPCPLGIGILETADFYRLSPRLACFLLFPMWPREKSEKKMEFCFLLLHLPPTLWLASHIHRRPYVHANVMNDHYERNLQPETWKRDDGLERCVLTRPMCICLSVLCVFVGRSIRFPHKWRYLAHYFMSPCLLVQRMAKGKEKAEIREMGRFN